MKKTLTIILIIALLSAFTYPVIADSEPTLKEENVYGILDSYGQVKKIYVVNSFNLGSITDYGTYTDLKNLSTDDTINIQDDKITINSDTDKIYYQGTLPSGILPWLIDIEYYLDGEVKSAEQIASKNGKAEILVSIKPNPDSDKFFYSNYTLSVNVELDERLFTNIHTDNAVIANAGMYKQLSYTVLPGNSIDISIKADVKDFQLNPITISGVRMIMDMQIDADSLTQRFKKLSDAITSLNDGAKELTEAFEAYIEGLTQYTDAQNSFNEGVGQLTEGISDIESGSASLAYGLNAVSLQGDPLKQAINGIVEQAFANANNQITQLNLELPVLTEQNYVSILENIPQLSILKTELDNMMQLKTGFSMYTSSVSQLSQAASQLSAGIVTLNASAKTIKQYCDTLTETAATLLDAATQLKKGLLDYKAGINALDNETKGMAEAISKEIDSMISDIFGNSDIVRSYVSDKNTSVSSVQFVMKTEAVESQKADETVIIEEPRLTFWQRLLKLFGLYK